MMGIKEERPSLFSYHVNLEKRIPENHPLRKVKELIDFGFIRSEVEHFYGNNGNVSVDPSVILKLMFLLFFDDISSERELMGCATYLVNHFFNPFFGFIRLKSTFQSASPLRHGFLRHNSGGQ